ncbi:polysaccharide export outer membrane protein [Leeuwenhoekiella polynyae]|uniref:Polysaccharide export outer membrane protein n=1 Tax=Leeuwenhoekiella polynyae TaxID=1550906 RepID=A0A4Q0PFE9_9FLAO|nr:polysaccharide export outer membrane protein [Leeuwenhoekiella polynyae]
MRMYFSILLVLLFSSCSRNLIYFSDASSQDVSKTKRSSYPAEPVLQPGDLLSIQVTSLNAEADKPFNRFYEGSNSQQDLSDNGYLIDQNGEITFPVLGTVSLGGQSKSAAQQQLTQMLKNYLSEPKVRIRYLNFRITVLGEVANPSTFTVPTESISILEALGLAGDMTVYGKRENVLLIKQSEGERKLIRLNLNNSEILDSPYFYLDSNDVVYVEPIKARKEQASTTRSTISLILSAISIATLFILYK